jgi:uncharacterized phage protein (TIGR02220 family)
MSGKIPGGYILLARKTLESEIMKKPPLFFKLWGWMLLQAKFKLKNGLERGQFKTSIAEMREAMSYLVGYRKETPTTKQIRAVYESLTKGSMIGTTKVTGGMIVTILNYEEYQDPKNYEGHNERVHEREVEGTSYNIEEREERKNDIHTRVVGYLNRKTGSSFKPTTKTTQEYINARVSEGFAPEDFKTVIDFKCTQWLNNPEKQEYLRPQTLFCTKFESYLEAAKRAQKPINGDPRKTPEQAQAEVREALS